MDQFDVLVDFFQESPFTSQLVILAVAPAFALGAWAKRRFSESFHRYAQVYSLNGWTGCRAAQRLLDLAGINEVHIFPNRSLFLSDHYNFKTKEVLLSEAVFNGSSVAAIGIAAHEVGHAMQHADNCVLARLRAILFPLAKFGYLLAIPLLLAGVFSSPLVWVGIGLFACSLIFPLVNLPMEFDASARARKLLIETGIIMPQEQAGVDEVLRAAAMTYVAHLIQVGLALFLLVGFWCLS